MRLFFALAAGCILLGFSPAMAQEPAPAAARAAAIDANAPVTIRSDDATFTLSNGLVSALVSKKSGDLISMKYRGVEMLATLKNPDGTPDLATDPPGANTRGFAPFTDHQYGFWSHDTTSPESKAAITIDPRTNGESRGEVAIKAISHGTPLGKGPGGSFISDIEIRYNLGRGDSGIYTYCAFEHQPDYPETSLGEARFCVKLSGIFDWMLVDAHHNFYYPASQERGDDKYNYTSVQFEHPAFGWASTTQHTGFFFVNASVEYLTGPPTKVEFLCHRDTNQVAAPCVLNYWRSSHYGGASVDIAQGEHWDKVIGPFLLYCNTGADPQEIWADAVAQVGRENKKWPYEWVSGVDYPHHDKRGTVVGQLVLSDPGIADASMWNVRVGLAHPDYTIPTERQAATNSPRDIDWQVDAKNYEFWVHGENDGSFSIPNVRPGTYTLHAIADGVLGEFAKTDITVEAGKTLDLGKLNWQPVRHGKQVWQIGIPNRNGSEFAHGDDYFHDGLAGAYAQLFPNDVNYVVGKSDFTRDWWYEQVPHIQPPAAPAPGAAGPGAFPVGAATRPLGGTTRPAGGATRPFGGAAGGRRGGFGAAPVVGRATPWTISFDLPAAPRGKATLRFAIATANSRQLDVAVNDQATDGLRNLSTDSSIGRNGIQGLWYERDLTFDAGLFKSGTNVIKLTVPPGGPTAGIIYDCIRLEIDDAAK